MTILFDGGGIYVYPLPNGTKLTSSWSNFRVEYEAGGIVKAWVDDVPQRMERVDEHTWKVCKVDA